MKGNPLGDLGQGLGDYLREQRQAARLSVRQLSELAGVSNPYLSQIERGLKKPSAEILNQLAKGLEVSAESLYVRAGILDERAVPPHPRNDVRRAIADDGRLTARQKQSLLEIYESFIGSADADGDDTDGTDADGDTTAGESKPTRTTPKPRAEKPAK